MMRLVYISSAILSFAEVEGAFSEGRDHLRGPLRAVADAFRSPVEIAKRMSVKVDEATNYVEAAREACKGAKKILAAISDFEDPSFITLRQKVSGSRLFIKSYLKSFSEGNSRTLKSLTNELVANATKLAEKDGRLRDSKMKEWIELYGGHSASMVDGQVSDDIYK